MNELKGIYGIEEFIIVGLEENRIQFLVVIGTIDLFDSEEVLDVCKLCKWNFGAIIDLVSLKYMCSSNDKTRERAET